MIRRSFPLCLLLALLSVTGISQESYSPSTAELLAITERGRFLAAYDQAAWHATDAVMALKPKPGSFTCYIARNTGTGWNVVFGRINDTRDKFLVSFEASRALSAETVIVEQYETPREETGFYLLAAKAIETARGDVVPEKRPYNISVLPALSSAVYVYVTPGQTKNEVYPLGGDVRYLVKNDRTTISEKRRLHASILEIPYSANSVAGYHTHVLSDLPEDTDVFYVLARKPLIPELISSRRYTYQVNTDGSIHFLGNTNEFLKTGQTKSSGGRK